MKILVIQQKMIGDVLLSSIICRNLRIAYPDAQIDYMVYESTKAVLEGNTDFNNLVLFKKEHRDNKASFFQLLKEIRAEKYDIVIDAYSKLESYLPVLFSGAKQKIAYNKPVTRLFYSDTVDRVKESHSGLGLAVDHRLALLEPLNLDIELKPRPKIYVQPEEKRFAIELFKRSGINTEFPTLMLSIIGSLESKTYPISYMAQLIDFIAENRKINILFNYIPTQLSLAQELLNACKPKTREKIYFEVLGNDIREFIAIMNVCDMIIGNDGGAINMAKALDKPAFIIFSPWIDKKAWATFEDGVNNVSVHLKDFKPQLFQDQPEKELKKRTIELYEMFTPDLIEPALEKFLDTHLK